MEGKRIINLKTNIKMETITKTNEGFKIYNTTTHKFGLKARLLILIGKPLQQSITITVDKEVEVLKTESSGYIEDLFPKKSVGMMEMPNTQERGV